MDKKFILLWAVTLIAAFFAGRSISGTQAASETNSSKAKKGVSPHNKPDVSNRAGSIKNGRKFSGKKADPKIRAMNLITDLKQLLGDGSMMVNMDFASFAESYNLVKDAEEAEIIAALDHLAGNGNAMTNMYPMLLLMGRYAEIDPKSSLSYYDENVKNPQMKMVMLGTIIAAWAKTDPDSTYDWYVQRQKDNPDESGNQFGGDSMSLASIFQGLAKQDLEDSFKKLKDLKLDGFKAQMASYGIAGALKEKEDYVSYLSAIKDWDNASQLRQSALQNWVFRDPDSASEWINSIEDEKDRSKAGKEVLQSWLMMDSAGATEWYMNLNEDKGKASTELIDQWAMTDAKAASEWLKKQDLENNQQAILKMVESSQYSNPKISSEWLNKIDNEKVRKEKTADIYRNWKSSNKNKAEEFLNSTPYAEEIRKQEKELLKVEDIGDFEDPE